MPRVLLDAEVRRLKQFRDENDLRALGGGLAHQLLGARKVRGPVPAAAKLHGANRHRSRLGLQMRGRGAHSKILPGLRNPVRIQSAFHSPHRFDLLRAARNVEKMTTLKPDAVFCGNAAIDGRSSS